MTLCTTLLANHFYWVFLFFLCLEFYADVLEITVCFFSQEPTNSSNQEKSLNERVHRLDI